MQIRTIATLAVAILLGLIAVVLVRNYIRAPEPGSPASGKAGVVAAGMVPMVVAAQPIERGTVLLPNSLKVVQVPQDAAPVGVFQSVDQLTGAEDVQRVALRAIVANEPILPGKVTEPGQRGIMSTLITEGMRAVSLPASEVTGVAGFVLPGDRVDVLLTREAGGTTVTQTLADNVIVLGVAQSNNDEANTPVVVKAVTVQVTPDQAQIISLSRELGDISLALRSIKDKGLPMRNATTVAALGFGGAAPSAGAPRSAAPRRAAPAAPTPPPAEVIRVTRGTEVTSYQFSGR